MGVPRKPAIQPKSEEYKALSRPHYVFHIQRF